MRGEHHERLRDGQGATFEGDLAFLHGFEQRGLGFRRGAVDFVGQQQVGENRAFAQLELLGLQVVHRMTGDVAGHQVRGELDAREFTAEAAGEGANQQGLAQPGHTFKQHMAACNQRGQDVVDHRVLTDQGFLQFLAQRLGQLAGALALLGGMAR
ncbi:hypothetical protein D3C81_1747920 [compost metagenome]